MVPVGGAFFGGYLCDKMCIDGVHSAIFWSRELEFLSTGTSKK